MAFEKYQSLERLGTQATEGILEGYVHVFFKIDGTNASLWMDERVRGGSRNRELGLQNDNAGFLNWAVKQKRFERFFEAYPHLRLYGEWLVPHSLKTYRDDAWRDFYAFDVLNDETKEYLTYDAYSVLLAGFEINYVPPLAIIKNPSNCDILKLLEKSGQYLVKDGEGGGEGLVFKNYDYTNKYGDKIWAKMITNEFKEVHHKEMGAPLINGTLLIEERIVDEFATEEFFKKELAKIELDQGGWSPKLIPMYLGKTWNTFLKEETPNFCHAHKDPTVNFRTLRNLFQRKAKGVIGL